MHSVEIVPGLMIGNRDAALDQAFHEDIRYGMVMNCTPDIPFLQNNFTRYWRVPILDIGEASDVEQLAIFLPTLVKQIDKTLKANMTVLVHCAAGRQRSAAVIAAYLMKTQNLTCEKAIAFVQSKKRDTFFPEANFYNALKDYEKTLQEEV